ncbi:nose resistant to fluoxetine protein 6-like [Cloeon dipterum]|uniref:nose resistant to fluoxetine protein 6-like n=1 Tax=Cloeon dipterum TaxID=197152 RepID=UPI0032200D67
MLASHGTIIVFTCFFISFAYSDCNQDITEYINGLTSDSPQLWALQMFDSSTKAPLDGIYEKSFAVQVGNFDQCVALKGPNGPDDSPRFTGQYCQFTFQVAQSRRAEVDTKNVFSALMSPYTSKENQKKIEIPYNKWAVCAPSSCDYDGVKRVADFNMRFFASALNETPDTYLVDNSCYHVNDGTRILDAGSWSFIVFVLVLALVILVSTVLDVLEFNISNEVVKIVIASFSLSKNIAALTKLPTSSQSSSQLNCLNGMRAISMLWIILNHAYSNAQVQPMDNYITYPREFSKQWFMGPILNGYLSVDTFFLLGGVLTAYVPLMDHAKGRKFHLIKYYIYRYLRITVPFAVVTWYVSTLNFYVGNGPLWFDTFYNTRKNCQKNWWAGLLYVSNYFEGHCLGHGWYLCVDMQYALLAPLIIYPLMRKPKYGLIAIGVLALASTIANFTVTYIEELPWAIMLTNIDQRRVAYYWEYIYENSPMRAAPYLLGMALGYLLSKKQSIRLPKWSVALGWFLSIGLNATVVFLIFIPYSVDYVYNPLDAAFYGSLHRLAWALTLSWIVWACVNGYGGVADRILSWKYFVPMSKMTFSSYLVHLPVIYVFMALRQTPTHVSHFEILYWFSGFVMLSMPFTLLLYLWVESPLMTLLRLIFKKKKE